MQQENK